ncbi:hypothetical protein [Phormidium nigroviride]
MQIKTSKSGISAIVAAVSAIGVAVVFLPQPSHAQNSGAQNSAQPLQDFQTQDSTDPFSGRGNGMGIFDLIHRSRLGTLRNMDEFSSEQQQNLNDAAAEFREKQRLLLEQQAKPGAGAIAPGDDVAPLP